ncbi:MAG: hypothetical protein MHM6MM_008748 [Cercozoa sp. M6MM]
MIDEEKLYEAIHSGNLAGVQAAHDPADQARLDEEYKKEGAEMGFQTPLMIAAQHGMLEIVKYLVVEGKSDTRLKDSAGATAEDLARDHGQAAVADFLAGHVTQASFAELAAQKEQEEHRRRLAAWKAQKARGAAPPPPPAAAEFQVGKQIELFYPMSKCWVTATIIQTRGDGSNNRLLRGPDGREWWQDLSQIRPQHVRQRSFG